MPNRGRVPLGERRSGRRVIDIGLLHLPDSLGERLPVVEGCSNPVEFPLARGVLPVPPRLDRVEIAVDRLDRYALLAEPTAGVLEDLDRKSTRLNSSHYRTSRMPSSA